jgi:hypothetical protein
MKSTAADIGNYVKDPMNQQMAANEVTTNAGPIGGAITGGLLGGPLGAIGGGVAGFLGKHLLNVKPKAFPGVPAYNLVEKGLGLPSK